MPNRIIKESICDDEKIAVLKDFEFRLWIGLITQADDAGRGDARAAIIKGRVFPLRDQVTVKGIADGLAALATIGLIALYEVGGRLYYVLPNWAKHQRIRDCKPKYPAPEDAIIANSAANCGDLPQVAATCGEPPRTAALIQSESESESNTKNLCDVPQAAAPPAPRKKYGEYGWVRLNQSEHSRLLEEFGAPEVERCIAYVDELAQSSGNKNKWRDWNLVIRRCHREGWGNKGGTTKPAAQGKGLSRLAREAVQRAIAEDSEQKEN